MHQAITGAGESHLCADPLRLISTQKSVCFRSSVKAREIAVGQESSLAHGRVSPFDLFGSSTAGIKLTHFREGHCPTLSESLQDLWLYFSSALGDKPNREMGHCTDGSGLPQGGSHQ